MLLRNDELNVLRHDLKQYQGDSAKIKDLVLDWLLLAYADGVDDVNRQLSGEWQPDIDRVQDVISADVGGMTIDERIDQYIYLEDIEGIADIVSNERQRVYNTASYDTATALKATTKTWHCMMLPTSRDTHIYLDGITKPMDAEFYTFNGNSAMYPQGFGEPEEDINCLCYLSYGK